MRYIVIFLISLYPISCNSPKIDNLGIASIEIMYVENWHMTTTLPLSCERLRNGYFPYDEITIEDRAEIEKWETLLDSITLIPWEGNFSGDCRICCVFNFLEKDTSIELEIWPTGLKYNNVLYEYDSAFSSLLSPILPMDYFK